MKKVLILVKKEVRCYQIKNKNRKVAAAIGIFNDIAERKLTEGELKSACEQLKRVQMQLVQFAKMTSLGFLAGSMAHEINNPLSGILNNVQLIRMIAEQRKEFSLDDFKELLGAIEDSTLRCKKITQSLLDFSHPSKGTLQPLSLNEVIEKVVALIEHELKLQNVAIQKDLQPDLPLVLGDFQLLQQVVFDLVSNAKWAIQKKSEKEGGLITIKTHYDPEKKSACLFIFDTGIGMPKENMERIFRPFFTTKPMGEGIGLGLFIVYNIIKEHKGAIEVESRVNEGTTFKITFPASFKKEPRG